MPKTVFMVRSVVADPAQREKFDHWYSTDHMPWAMREFKAEKAWRYWSDTDKSAHYAFYQFADKTACDAAMKGEGLKKLIADFDRVFPSVTRTRDVMVMAEERGPA